jgi:hypothetical protein
MPLQYLPPGLLHENVMPGSVVYELKPLWGKLLAHHVSIVLQQGPESYSLTIFDWPYRVGRVGGTQRYESSRTASFAGKPICLAWLDDLAVSSDFSLERLFDIANRMRAVMYTSIAGRVPYRLQPSRPTRQERAEYGQNYFIGSCVGFVEECFDQAGIDLVGDAERDLPLWSADALSQVFELLFDRVFSLEDINEYMMAQDSAVAGRPFLPGYQLTALVGSSFPFRPVAVDQALYNPTPIPVTL